MSTDLAGTPEKRQIWSMEMLISLVAVAVSLVAVVMARAAQTETLSQAECRQVIAEVSDMLEQHAHQRAREASRHARAKKEKDPEESAPAEERPADLILDKRELQARARRQGLLA